MNRCLWPGTSQKMIEYHDTEWGVPLHNDAKLFEFLVLDAFQAGLSWSAVLNKRANIALDSRKAKRNSLFICSASSSDAMYIIFVCSRCIVINNMCNIGNIKSPRCNIRCN